MCVKDLLPSRTVAVHIILNNFSWDREQLFGIVWTLPKNWDDFEQTEINFLNTKQWLLFKVVRTREPEAFWRENVMAVIILF